MPLSLAQSGMSALHLAAQEGRESVVSLLQYTCRSARGRVRRGLGEAKTMEDGRVPLFGASSPSCRAAGPRCTARLAAAPPLPCASSSLTRAWTCTRRQLV